MSRWLIWTLVSILFWGLWGVVSTVASRHASAYAVQAIAALGILPVAIALATPKRFREGSDLRRGAFWAFATGLCGGTGNVILFWALGRGGEASTLYPLTSLYPVVTLILAVAFLGERLNAVQGSGFVLALASVVLFNVVDPPAGDPAGGGWLSEWTLCALPILLLWGVGGITQKLATRHGSDEWATFWFAVAFLAIAAGLLAAGKVGLDDTPAGLGWSALLGLITGLAMFTGFAAYRGGTKASVVTALIALYPVVTVAVSVPLFGESFGWRKGAGTALAIVAGLALTHEKTGD